MQYAKVAVGVAVNDPFDYHIPLDLAKNIDRGSRVWVNLRTSRIVGYVVDIVSKTALISTKPILELIDQSPILDKFMLSLAREIADYYCCSVGQAIEAMLPEKLRQAKEIPPIDNELIPLLNNEQKPSIVSILDIRERWSVYLKYIKEVNVLGQEVLILLPDIQSLQRAKDVIINGTGITPTVFYRGMNHELQEWVRIKEGKSKIVLGLRSAIFAPLNNLGLIIIEDEQDPVYKQDQVPHYHAREVAFMRQAHNGARLLLGGKVPSVDVFYLSQKKSVDFPESFQKNIFPKIEVFDLERLPFAEKKNKAIIISGYLQDAILAAINSSKKVLLFLNRKGFATLAACNSCGVVLKCPRCNINLNYHFQENILNCHYCNYKISVPNICPVCNSGYIRYSGGGTEKLESEIARIFPQARILRVDDQFETGIGDANTNISNADICIATQKIVKQAKFDFDLTAILSVDASLNRVDFRSSEKTFSTLVSLTALTKGKMIIQTRLPKHHVFAALANNDPGLFYKEELMQRKQLGFPPYRHFGIIKLRGENEPRVKDAAQELFQKLALLAQNKTLKVISFNPGQPAKLRGNFYWQILLSAGSALAISKFLKINLKKLAHSGIIVTVDIDPA